MNSQYCVIELIVKNHPGVMSHITGLFARRAFNLEGILCGQIGNSEDSRMYLLVKNDERLEQIIKQVQKLYDVKEVSVCKDCKPSIFSNISELVKNSSCEI
ncbi:acetolactate synthase small subunit [Pseudobacteroides cellulosolvens]|uniref:Acetolactate synthase small subunit n=1 Tax=Pseudobacteroides cellulosolvens ATCC 35603 = DSM 2933 TaxID=398512 RepID=A0A0L6JKE3_9FIRM|nr:acetolactate synthase small subunit [Pseudobacteroides cellulosolvens]KNY26239.1 acetolactate synthase, small subunit [Pseudobacteroides cellulosolvens ATCC 35603 = DSM 2933]